MWKFIAIIAVILNAKNCKFDWWILRLFSKELRKQENLDSRKFIEAEKRFLIMIQKEFFTNEKR